jgi:aminocarboxymuconate-semialdehyde decarboxylase
MDLIDVHSHIVPQRFPDNPSPATNSRWPCMHARNATEAAVMIGDKPFREIDSRSWEVSRRIDDMDRDRVSMQALSPMPELLSYWFAPSDGLEMARWMNHTIASMVSAAPKRFAGLGIVPLQDPALAAAELGRLQRDGFSGIEIGSNVNGVVLGDRRFDEFYAEAERLNLAIFVHALHPIGADRLQAFPDLVPFAAFPLDTALTAISLMRAGVPQRHPNLRIGFSHGGGAIVPLTHRLAQGWKVTNGFGGAMQEPPMYYAQRFFYDSLVYEPGYLRHLVGEFAPGQVFGGTDYPYAIMETQLRDFLTSAETVHRASLFNGAAKRFLALEPG